MNWKPDYQRYLDLLSESYKLKCISSLLNWDQQVNLPGAAGSARAQQIELVDREIYKRATSTEYRSIVHRLSDKLEILPPDERINISYSLREVERAVKLSEDFIARKSRAHSEAYLAWVGARAKSSFADAKPFLRKNVELAREETELVGYEGHCYNALLDQFEPGATLEIIDPLFKTLGEGIRSLLSDWDVNKKQERVVIGTSIEQQKKLNSRIISDIGYDLNGGRLDAAPHPFASTLGPNDTRITTRYDELNIVSSLYASLHEAGHALYEQGLPQEFAGTPRGEANSLGLHESQARFWENIIGRGSAFCRYLKGVLEEVLPKADLQEVSASKIFELVNTVKPSLIRVEADEVTYSLHILVRTQLEVELTEGSLSVSDLPARWNDLYKKYLGIEVSSDREGVLQDVHWFGVGFGYFPTYALGNIYSALIWEKIVEDLSSTEEDIASGRFERILGWLRESIHSQGMSYQPGELIKRSTGKEISVEPYINYLKGKKDFIQSQPF